MFRIDLEGIHPAEIEEMCSNERTYRKGEHYFFAEHVQHIEYLQVERRVISVVKGERAYHCSVSFDLAGQVKGYTCTCEAFQSYRGACKHLAATMLEIYERCSQLHYNQQRGGQSSHYMIDAFKETFRPRSSLLDEEKERLQLHYELSFSIGWFGPRVDYIELRLRAGVQRPYIVKNIAEFLLAIEKKLPYTFTPKFTYEPDLHEISTEDVEILQHLMKIEEIKKTTIIGSRKGRSEIQEDRLMIPDVWFPDLLRLLAGVEHLAYKKEEGTLTPLFISELEARSFTFLVEQATDRSAVLRLEHAQEYLFFQRQHQAVIKGQDLFLLSEEQAMIVDMLQVEEDSKQDRKEQIARFSTSQLEGFCSYVLPRLEQIGRVHLDPKLKEHIYQYPLQAKLELEVNASRDVLTVQLAYQYGDVRINPLSEEANDEEREAILVRDVEQEEMLQGLLQQTALRRVEGGYLVEGEEEIVDFLFEELPLLEKYVDLYSTAAVHSMVAQLEAPPSVSLTTNERMNWLELDFSIEGIPTEEIDRVLKALRQKKKYYRLASGAFVHLEGEQFADLRLALAQLVPEKEKRVTKKMSVPLYKALALENHKAHIYKLSHSLQKLIQDLQHPEGLTYRQPEGLRAELRTYQQTGYKWLKTLAQFGLGGILADDMGLGKTLQTITFLLALVEEKPDSSALVVAPASLLYNWKREIERFAPELQVAVVAGTKEERGRLLGEFAQRTRVREQLQKQSQVQAQYSSQGELQGSLDQVDHLTAGQAESDSVIELFANDRHVQRTQDQGSDQVQSNVQVLITSYPLIQRDIALYEPLVFDALILDEAQAIKNDSSKTAKAVRELRALCTFALSGTPIENRLEELHALMHTIMPGLLGPKKGFKAMAHAEIIKRVRPFILRRLKKDVLHELPDKIEQVQYTELLEEQKTLYVAQVQRLKQDVNVALVENRFQESRMQILAGLTRLRQICCHPQLLLPDESHASGKFDRLLELAESGLESGQRMVIFSQFTSMLSLIRQAFDEKGWEYHYLDGSTPAEKRVELAESFNDGEHSFFLISMKAGGTGLNLIGGDTVILFDTWWNPAVEQQAADRVYRFGQKKTVQVIKLVTTGTIEEKMLALHEKKKALVEEIIQPGEQGLTSMTIEDIQALLQI